MGINDKEETMEDNKEINWKDLDQKKIRILT